MLFRSVEIKPVVTTIRFCPKTGVPEMVTVPDSVALSVTIFVEGLSDEAEWVSVAAIRAVNVYSVLGVNPLNVVVVCHTPPPLLYSAPAMVLSVMLVAVLLNRVGALGAFCVSFSTGPTGADITLPPQFAAVTVTVIILSMSANTKV